MRRVLLALGLLGGWSPAPAQSPPRPASPVPAFGEAIVVTASLADERERDLPVSVEVIDGEALAARQVTSVAEALATAAGLAVVRSGSPGQSTSLFVRGTESDHALVLWNGVPLNNPYFGGFNWAFLPTDGVDRVEVVRGPFSALYGGDAVGAVVQVISGSEPGGTVRLEGGEDAYRRLGASAALTGRRARFHAAGHLRRGGGPFANDEFDAEELAARGEWGAGPGLSVGLLGRWNDSRTGIPFSGGLPSPERRIAWRESQLALPVSLERGRWGLEGQLSYLAYDNAFRDPDDPFGFTAADTRSTGRRARAVGSRRFGDGWLAFGGELEVERVDDRSVFGTALDGEEQTTRAGFAQLHWRSGRLTVEAGLRRDSNDAYGGQTSPRLGLQVAVGQHTRVRVSYGESFRPPSIGELFFPFTGNPGLRPEVGRTVEAGVEHERGAWRAGLTLFEVRLDNLIDFDFASLRNVNLGRTRSRGAEARLGYRGRLAAITVAGTRLDAEDLATGLPLLRRPERSASATAFLYPGDWTVSLTALAVGERDDVDPATFGRQVNPGYVRLDLGGRWRAGERWAPYARLENLLDRDYAEALGFPAPGRTVVAGLEVNPW